MKFFTPGIAAPKCVRVTGGGRQKQEVVPGLLIIVPSRSLISFLLLHHPPPPPPYITLLRYHIFPIAISAFKKHTLKLVLQFCKRGFKKNCVFLQNVNERSSIRIVNNQSKVRQLLLFWYAKLNKDSASFFKVS